MSPMVVDPPEGWKYGFPKYIPSEIMQSEFDRVLRKSYREWLLKQGYPQELIESAMKHSRFWITENEENSLE